MRNGLTVVLAGTLGVLAAVAVVDALRSSPAPSVAAAIPPTTASPGAPTLPTLFAFGSRKGAIEGIGNTWAALYAADDPEACSYMGQGLCKLEPVRRFRASFEGATVQEIGFLNGYQAGARFSNGIVVEFFGDGGTWTIVRLAATERRFFE